MATVIAYHEVKDGDHWAEAWKKSPGNRHEMFAKIGVKHEPLEMNSILIPQD